MLRGSPAASETAGYNGSPTAMPEFDHKRPIIVTGAHRSGTTWTGRMLSLPASVFYIEEPLNRNNDPVRRGIFRFEPPYWYTYICDQNEKPFIEEFNRVFSCRFDPNNALRFVKPNGIKYSNTELKVIQTYADSAAAQLRCAVPLVKDPFALVSLPWFEKRFTARPVIMIRHPAAFVSSLIRLGWKHSLGEYLQQSMLMRDYPVEDPEDIEKNEYYLQKGNHIATAALGWKYLHSIILRYMRKYPHWIFMRHEDLSRNPLNGFHWLYQKLDLPFSEQIAAEIERYSKRGNPTELNVDSPHSIALDSSSNIQNWHHRLSHDHIRLIRALTKRVADAFYSDDDWIFSSTGNTQ